MSSNGKKSKKKVIIFSIAAVVLIALVLLVVLGSKREPVFTIQTEKAIRRTVTQTVTATGKIYPEVQVTITPEVSGEIVDLPVKEGMDVKRGQILVKIKPDIYIALRDQAVATQASAKASLARAEAEFKRAKNLFDKGLLSSSDLEQSNMNYEVARSNFDQAEAGVKQSNENLYKTTIYAPMDGTISSLAVERGDRVLGTSQFQGTTVMTVADLSKMEARVDVGENDIVLIAVGDTARIDVDAYKERKLTGVVYEIGNTAKTTGAGTQEEVTNFQVKIRVIDKNVTLRPGMSMTAVIETQTKRNVICVPIQSVTTRMAGQGQGQGQTDKDESDKMAANDSKIKQKTEKAREIVFIVDNNTVKMADVKRGISDDTYTEITSGLEEGKEVVSGSYKAINRELDEGSKVRVENTKPKPGANEQK